MVRDDGLRIFTNLLRPNIEGKKRETIKIFKSFGLSITVTINVTPANYLDVYFALTKDIYQPYWKPNDEPAYINRHSNNPPNIVWQIPLSLSSRISNISKNHSIFNSSIPMYKEALTKSGFNDGIIYTPVIESNNSERKNTWKRKINWFNPLHSLNVETNIGETFLKLVKKHFPRNNSFHKIFNKNTIKISYRVMRNISSIIASPNKSILRPKAAEYGCNRRNKESCPL